MSESAAFQRWRPKYHLMAPQGWMNDPCTPFYDAKTQLYHVAFQWNDKGNDWDSPCWGHATSRDFVSWNVDSKPWLSPGEAYDHLGIFTGCLFAQYTYGIHDGHMACFYTSVNHLPIQHSLKYTYGSETLSLAISRDSGKTLQKVPCNPILQGPPRGLDVTGWRDPFVGAWPSLSTFLGKEDKESLYGILSGGIAGVAPAVFLYSIDSHDLTRWTYLGNLVDLELNKFPSRWSGDLGVNWEVTTFLTLSDESGSSMEFLFMGAEAPKRSQECRSLEHNQARLSRWQLWMSGGFQTSPDIAKKGDRVKMAYRFGGILDHGCLYAANIFQDPQISGTVVLGWATEDDLDDSLRHNQGWSGTLSLPRVISIQTLSKVVRARRTELSEMTSFHTTADDVGTYEMKTLRIQPHPCLEKLRKHGSSYKVIEKSLELSEIGYREHRSSITLNSSHWELQCRIKMAMQCCRVGLVIENLENLATCTKLYYDSTEESFLIERPPVAALGKEIYLAPEIAPFTLFTQHDPHTNQSTEELLSIRIFNDSSILEAIVNERVAITTRLYQSSGRYRIKFFAEAGYSVKDGQLAEVVDCEVWDNLATKSC